MSPYLAYFLGLFTIIVIWLLFWFAARSNSAIRRVYEDTICNVKPSNNSSSTQS